MYTLLLCWKYLHSRRLTAICIVSVMLGVSTLIVVNSVIGGFRTNLRTRLHRLHADVIVEAVSARGFDDPDAMMSAIREDEVLSADIQASMLTLETYGTLHFSCCNQPMSRPVRVIGLDMQQCATVGTFSEFMVHSPPRRDRETPDTRSGVILGYSIGHDRPQTAPGGSPPRTLRYLAPGDEVTLSTVGGDQRAPVVSSSVVSGYFRSELHEFDDHYVLVPLDELRRWHGRSKAGNAIHLKLKDPSASTRVVARLRNRFGDAVNVWTWEDKQGPLLEAVEIEQRILTVLLSLIVVVAGFCTFAIFSMIVADRTRDVGILKSMGASTRGVMRIFLGYGLLLGVVGSLLGTLLGAVLTVHIDVLEQGLSLLTGQQVFPRDVFYFDRIPTRIDPQTVLLINAGAIATTMFCCILPAWRAARLRPVQALRWK